MYICPTVTQAIAVPLRLSVSAVNKNQIVTDKERELYFKITNVLKGLLEV